MLMAAHPDGIQADLRLAEGGGEAPSLLHILRRFEG